MPKAVDLMDNAFAEITKDGNLMLDDDFMMNIFEPLANKIQPFKQYLNYMFEEQQIRPVGLKAQEDKVYLYEFLCAVLYFPTQKDVLQSKTFSAFISVKALSRF